MRLQRYETQTGITSETPSIFQERAIPSPFQAGSQLSDAIIGKALQSKQRIETARKNAEVSRIKNNLNLKVTDLFERYNNNMISLDDMREEFDEYYNSELLDGVENEEVLQRVRGELSYMRDSFNIQMNTQQALEIKQAAELTHNNFMQSQLNLGIASNFDLSRREHEFQEAYKAHQDNIGILYDEYKADQVWDEYSRTFWYESFLSDLSLNPAKAMEMLEGGMYQLDQDLLTNARNVGDRALDQQNFENYKVLEQRILSGERFDDFSELQDDRYRLALQNIQEREIERKQAEIEAEARKREEEYKNERLRYIFTEMRSGEKDPEVLKNFILATGLDPYQEHNLIQQINNQYNVYNAGNKYMKKVLSGDSVFSMSPSGGGQDLVNNYYENGITPDTRMPVYEDQAAIKNLIRKTNIIPTQLSDSMSGTIMNATDVDTIKSTIESFYSVASGSADAVARLSDNDPGYQYLKWAYNALPSLGPTETARRIQEFKTRYQDPTIRERLKEYADSDAVTEYLNEHISDYNIAMQADIAEKVRANIKFGMIDADNAKEAVKTAIFQLENSPTGYGTSNITTLAAENEDSLYAGAHYTKMPANRLLGIYTDLQARAMSMTIKNDLERAGLYEPELRDKYPMGSGVGGVVVQPKGGRPQTYYRLLADDNTPITMRFWVEQVNKDGTTELLRDQNGEFVEFVLDGDTMRQYHLHAKKLGAKQELDLIRTRIYKDEMSKFLPTYPLTEFGRFLKDRTAGAIEDSKSFIDNFPDYLQDTYDVLEEGLDDDSSGKP